MIDLRSDTVTKPTDEMRKVIAQAEVGDDVWGDDPTVIKLQDLICELTGMPASLYVPSGTMSNQIAIASATNSGDEIICEASAHIVKYEAGAPALISRVMTKQIKSSDGTLDLEEVQELVRPENIHFPVTSMLCLENTHNSLGGRVLPLDYIHRAKTVAQANKLHFHCDGARLWNASVAANVSMKDYCTPFNSVSLCLSKGLGAPVGSVLVGSELFIEKAKRFRKLLGGGMRQAGIIAAGGIYAVQNHFERLKDDHANAKSFAKILSEAEFLEVDLNSVETNMVFFKFRSPIDQNTIINKLAAKDVAIGAAGKFTYRAVFHLQVSADEAERAANEIVQTISEISGNK